MENQTQLPSTEQNVEQLEKISTVRLQLLLAQTKSDFVNGLPKRDGSRKAPSVRSNNRILFTALATLTGGSVESSKPVDEYEQRAVHTLIECFNSVMLKLALDEAKKRKEKDGTETKQSS